ncbi:hypothetical protein D3C80_2040620 [compost metagenome]
MAINQIPVRFKRDRGTNPLPDQKTREQPLVKPVAGRLADSDTKLGCSDRRHPFERLGSAERG